MTNYQIMQKTANETKKEFFPGDVIRIKSIADSSYKQDAIGKLAIIKHIDDVGQIFTIYEGGKCCTVSRYYKDEFIKVDFIYDGTSEKLCPHCFRSYTDYPALSRSDNKTYICPQCGIKEAISSIKNI